MRILVSCLFSLLAVGIAACVEIPAPPNVHETDTGDLRDAVATDGNLQDKIEPRDNSRENLADLDSEGSSDLAGERDAVEDPRPAEGPDEIPTDSACEVVSCDPEARPGPQLGPCEQFVPAADGCSCVVVQKPIRASCDDGDPCTVEDFCLESGKCAGLSSDAVTAILCDDGNPCTLDDCEPGIGCQHTADTEAACTDGNDCTIGDACVAGVCQPGPYDKPLCGTCQVAADTCEALWGDGNPCTGVLHCLGGECRRDDTTLPACPKLSGLSCYVNRCVPEQGGCTIVPANDGSVCSDTNPCTDDDACQAGSCKGAYASEPQACGCEDNDDCAPYDDADLCNGKLRCVAGECRLDPFSLPSACDPTGDTPCARNRCIAATGACALVAEPDGTACDDANACTSTATCQDGTCQGGQVIDCSALDQACRRGTCDPATGSCTAEAVADSSPCTPTDPCVAEAACEAGVCLPVAARDCDDDDPCTVDACEPGAGCVHQRKVNDEPEVCNGADDDCDGLTDAEDLGTGCVDGGCNVPLLANAPCELQHGVCAGAQKPAGFCQAGVWQPCDPAFYAVNIAGYDEGPDASCDDLDNDCDGLTDEDYPVQATACGQGACARVGARSCVDGKEVDGCVPGVAAEEDATCDGSDDDCDGEADEDYIAPSTACGQGACAAAGERVCLGGQPLDTCEPGPPAANDALCNGVDDDCDGLTDEEFSVTATACGIGACARAGQRRCVDGAPRDTCVPGDAVAETCNAVDDDCDGVTDVSTEPLCAPGARCEAGECVPICSESVDDGNPCTIDSCDELLGERHEPVENGTPCADDTICNGDEACSLGACTPGSPLDCSVPSPCRVGWCDDTAGCQQDPVEDGTTCDNDNLCDGREVCWLGDCLGGEPLACKPSGPCRLASCDPESGCDETQAVDGTPCDDGDPLTQNDACMAGTCIPGAKVQFSFLPDTGLGTCYDAAGNEIPCGMPSSSHYGQDGDFVAHPLAYTDLGDKIRDLTGGLVWEKTSAARATYDRLGAEQYCATLALDGQTWRLPNRRELMSVVDYSKVANQAATIDSAFGATYKGYYWTRDTAGAAPGFSMRVSFKYGTSTAQDDTQADGYVRCVTGTSKASEARYIPIPQEAGVFDESTGLFWQRLTLANVPWQAALDACVHLNAQEYAGWRLPDVKELSTLLKPGAATPASDPEAFPGIKAGQLFWSSTTSNDPTKKNYAYVVGLGDVGDITLGRKIDNYQVMCTRSCPCVDARCCFRCSQVDDGSGCDDADPTTVHDRCIAGVCAGSPAGTPDAPPEPPFDCQKLDCGPGGTCVRHGEVESCECKAGFIAIDESCVFNEAYTPEVVAGCRPFDNGVAIVCLGTTVVGTPDPEAAFTPDVRSLDEAHLSPPPGFAIHGQDGSSWCMVHAVNAALELLSGVRYVGLSEAHAVSLVAPEGQSAAFCNGFDGTYLSKLAGTNRCLVSDGIWDVDYETSTCDASVFDPATVDSGTLDAEGVVSPGEHKSLIVSDGAVNLGMVKAALHSGQPVVVGVPVVAGYSQWKTWVLGVETSTFVTPIIDDTPWKRKREVRCGSSDDGMDLDKCYCEQDDDCNAVGGDAELTCTTRVCTVAGHAVLLVGYDDNDSHGRFWFLNSWNSPTYPWGRSHLGFADGIGKMSYEFVQRRATYAEKITSVRLACVDPDFGGCTLGQRRCTASQTIEECVKRSDGCHEYQALASKCAAGREQCSNGACVPTCTDECQLNDTGCVNATARWSCTPSEDADACYDRQETACTAGQICDDGVCVADCKPKAAMKCQGNQVWWYDSCNQPDEWIKTCAGTCSNGACETCTTTTDTTCLAGNVYSLDSCGNPTTLKQSCGTSGYIGTPYCSADRTAEVRDKATRGCAAGACTSAVIHESTPCVVGVCVDGTCQTGVNTCSDGACTPGVEDCKTCPDDCPCWDGGRPYCNATGQCVQCTADAHCPGGSTCQDGSCVAGCNLCTPLGQPQCAASGTRQECTQVGNCRRWVDSPCGAGTRCCQGGCASTAAPPAPSLDAPAADATVSSSTVRFQWTANPGTSRVTLAICKSSTLSGSCLVHEPPPGYWYLDVALSPGTWYWSVRGITACDASAWGGYAAARKVTVSSPVAETCNGVDDDNDGRTDNAGANGMGCLREVFHFERIVDANNHRLQWNPNPGVAPAAPPDYRDPAWMASEGRHPSFLVYNDTYGIANLAKLYYCVRSSAPFDNLYTTNWQTECSGYDVKGEANFIGYVFTADPGGSAAYGNWLYSPYVNQAARPAPLWRLRRPATNQHQFTAFERTITDRIGQGWCCERGPSYVCEGHWCGGANTYPVGWVVVPK